MNETELNRIFQHILENKSRIYKAGAFFALGIILIYLIDLAVVLTFGLAPKTVPELFELIQRNRLIIILQAFAPDLIAALFRIPLMIALFIALIKIKRSFLTLAVSVALAFIGIAVYFSYNGVFSMVWLSDQFALAEDDALKQQLLSAGHAFLSSFNANGTQPFMAFTLYAISGILISVVMLKSPDFGKTIAIIGIIGNALELGPPTGLYPEIWGKIDPVLIGIGGVFLMIWYALIVVKLLKLAKSKVK
jgi:hypothetical protein